MVSAAAFASTSTTSSSAAAPQDVASTSQVAMMESSSNRGFRNFMTALFHDIWVTKAVSGCSVCPFSDEKIDGAPEVQENPKLGQVIRKINHMGPVPPSALNSYAKYLQREHARLGYWGGWMASKTDLSEMPSPVDFLLNVQTLIAIPVSVKSFRIQHCVLFVVDLEQATIEYYDPKGLSLMDREGDAIKSNPKFDLPKFAVMLCNHFQLGEVIIGENTFKHQTDSHNCAIHVGDYIRRRSEGESASSVRRDKSEFVEINSFVRRFMMLSLAPSLFS